MVVLKSKKDIGEYEMRDKAWLSKQVESSTLTDFSIDNIDEVTKTIISEMKELFPNCQLIEDKEAALAYQIITDAKLGDEGFAISQTNQGILISANTTRGLLYGCFHLHRELAMGKEIPSAFQTAPAQAFRMLNHWDNFDGSVERGYAGESIFYKDNLFRHNYDTIREYARLLASVGINKLSINNVNVHKEETFFITDKYLTDIKALADIFYGYGIDLYLSVNFAAPVIVDGLATADPIDTSVAAFWQKMVDKIYEVIPHFGGFVVKADSEGEPGPFTYGRNHDEGANMLARALKPHGGKVIWRCFVYNCLQDWRDRSIDRARAAYDNFVQLDGKFDDNVILQIKNGPIDFQVREPISPLFGVLKKTNQILEFQVTQEYTGQQKHVCYLLPMWKEVLDFDTKHKVAKPCVKDIVRHQSLAIKDSGIAAVVNVGMDNNWTGHKLAQANLYGYGRIIWDDCLSSAEIANEWIDLTFDLEANKKAIIAEILMTSYQAYEDYTAPLGIGFMVRPNHHYGPDVDGYEYDRWGTYHFADRNGIGVNRTAANGTGYARQYSDARFAEYEDIATCPDELVLFFHHLPYTHVLQSKKTLIQHIYDTHFAGYEKTEQYLELWQQLADVLDAASYTNVAERLEEQRRCARDWRDQINTYFYRKSGIADERGRKIY